MGTEHDTRLKIVRRSVLTHGATPAGGNHLNEEATRMASQRARIMVIEDDQKLGKLVQRIFLGEHDIVLFAEAREVLDRIIAGESFDLVLCDLMLPGMSGMVFHERVERVAPELVARVVFLTGGPCTESARDFLERTDIRHIRKPFTAAELRDGVRVHLQRVGHGRPDADDRPR